MKVNVIEKMLHVYEGQKQSSVTHNQQVDHGEQPLIAERLQSDTQSHQSVLIKGIWIRKYNLGANS